MKDEKHVISLFNALSPETKLFITILSQKMAIIENPNRCELINMLDSEEIQRRRAYENRRNITVTTWRKTEQKGISK